LTYTRKYNIEVFQSIDALNKAVADYIVTVSNKAIAERGRFTIALSGGDSPQKLYALLAKTPYSEQIEWKKIFVFWGDERWVPIDDKRNNAYQVKSILLDKVIIPASNIHRIPVNLSPNQAVIKYEKELRAFFENKPIQLDVILLGLGENGHTASLFPGTKVIHEHAEGIRFVEGNPPIGGRITMTAALINRARHILFLVTGEKKAGILGKVLDDSYQPNLYPAQLIKPIHGDLIWFADQEAASLIKQF
jgi:6-phosphogluconolactonase